MKLFTKDELQHEVEEGLVKSTAHPDAPLIILNYTPKCAYDRLWSPVSRACRGLIVDAELNVLARPFPKFFNLQEHEREYEEMSWTREEPLMQQVPRLPSGRIEVTEKMDGSLGILYYVPGEALPRIATRGSFTSEQALIGTQMLREHILHYDTWFTPEVTHLFEIIYPGNRIVVNYGTDRRLVLLARIFTETGEDLPLFPWYPDCVPIHRYGSMMELLEAPARENAEGYVVRFKDTPAPNLRVKIKHEEYVRLHRIVTGISSKHIWEYLRDDRDMRELLEGVPDEFNDWVREVEAQLWGEFCRISEGCLNDFLSRPETDDRRTIAEYFKTRMYPQVLFLMLDGKDWAPPIWKLIRPETSFPYKTEV